MLTFTVMIYPALTGGILTDWGGSLYCALADEFTLCLLTFEMRTFVFAILLEKMKVRFFWVGLGLGLSHFNRSFFRRPSFPP